MEAEQTLQTMIASELRKGIFEGKFHLGEWLRQDEIAAQFNVSRMPVRAALVQLEAEGLVDLHRYRGAMVRPLSIKEIEELFWIRVILESEAAYRGASQVSPDGIATMTKLIGDMREAADIDEYLRLNRQFHDIVYHSIGSLHIEKMIGEVRNNVERYLRIYMGLLEQIDLRHEEHEEILEACKQGDGLHAREATKQHVNATAQTLLQTLGRVGWRSTVGSPFVTSQ